LPQLFNVIAGSMSLVGPRPLVEWESRAALDTHPERFEMPPGITGLSQLAVRNGAGFAERLDMDVEYCRRWRPLLDVALLAKTPGRVLRGDDVYPSARPKESRP
ncbi:MAG TPA: sugar transferase, partial [Gemmataceae bacterium]|nr:sugar transferase [Gemmataceae bacterium]